MRIVDRAEFLALPSGSLFSYTESPEELRLKYETEQFGDYWMTNLANAGVSFDDKDEFDPRLPDYSASRMQAHFLQRFYVYDRPDVERFLEYILRPITGAYGVDVIDAALAEEG
jgi:hypothetical protein